MSGELSHDDKRTLIAPDLIETVAVFRESG